MNSFSILSPSSAFTTSAYSAYGATKATSVKSEQEISDANNSATKSKPLDDLEDKAIISKEAQALAGNELIKSKVEQNIKFQKTSNDENEQKLNAEEKKQVAELQAADTEVKAHEKAHVAASGGISASAPSYTYQKGPDGQNYAVAGQVQIKTSGSSDPEKALADAEAMKSAALAPGNPSGADMKVAANADQMISEAKQKKDEATQEETKTKNKEVETKSEDQ